MSPVKKRFKTIGIVGGLGPWAGVSFAQKLIELNKKAMTDQDHPPFILYSNSQIPSRMNFLLGKNEESPVPELVRSLEVLRRAGADFGVMICNTAHIFLSEIRKQTQLPILSLIEETAKFVKEGHEDGESVGILATDPTLERGIYKSPLAEEAVELIVPDKEYQELVMKAIFDENVGIKATGVEISKEVDRWLASVIKHYRERGINRIILGCTEVSMVASLKNIPGVEIIDPLEVLARKCLIKAGVDDIPGVESGLGSRIWYNVPVVLKQKEGGGKSCLEK